MLSVLWIEDDIRFIVDLAPVVLSVPGISVSALVFGEASNIQIEGMSVKLVPSSSEAQLSMDAAWQHVLVQYKSIRPRPWLVISDLRLASVATTFSLRQPAAQDHKQSKKISMAGIDLTYRLFKETECRNVIWLTNFGPDVLHRTDAFVVKNVDGISGAQVIEFPRTYVLEKDLIGAYLKSLIERIVTTSLLTLRAGDAIFSIRASTIASLFKILLGHAGSVKHYFNNVVGSEFSNRVNALASLDLLPNNDPPMNFDVWLRAWSAPGQQVLDDVTPGNCEEFADTLAVLLARELWGMKVEDLLVLMKRVQAGTSDHQVLAIELESLLNYDDQKVIGPVVRDSLICALSNAFQNAVTAAANVPSGGIELKGKVMKDAIYLLLHNTVADAGTVRREMIGLAKRESLNGVLLIRGAIDELNQLHHRQSRGDYLFGGWGFAYFVGGKKLFESMTDESGVCTGSNWFAAGAPLTEREVNELFDIRRVGEHSVAVVFRLPLETPADLAFKNPKSGVKQKSQEKTANA